MWTSSNSQVKNEENDDESAFSTIDLFHVRDCSEFEDLDTNNLAYNENNFDNNQPKKTHLLYEGQTVENFVSEFDGFYNEMMAKMKTLRHPPIRKSKIKAETKIDETKLFKNMKNTPDIQKKLNFIRKLDEDIEETISTYRSEKEERMETQLQMCNEIQRHTISAEREAGTFLDLCQYEYAESIEDAEEAKQDDEETTEETKRLTSYKGFVKRNKLLAKEGVLASFSLTDEEKCKLEEILSVKEDNLKGGDEITEQSVVLQDDDENCDGNTYVIDVNDRQRLEEIDEQLEKIHNDEAVDRAVLCKSNKSYGDTSCEYMLQKELKKIDDRLEMLRREEEEKVKELDVVLQRLDEDWESKGY